jgi:hypothetical protein
MMVEEILLFIKALLFILFIIGLFLFAIYFILPYIVQIILFILLIPFLPLFKKEIDAISYLFKEIFSFFDRFKQR